MVLSTRLSSNTVTNTVRPLEPFSVVRKWIFQKIVILSKKWIFQKCAYLKKWNFQKSGLFIKIEYFMRLYKCTTVRLINCIHCSLNINFRQIWKDNSPIRINYFLNQLKTIFLFLILSSMFSMFEFLFLHRFILNINYWNNIYYKFSKFWFFISRLNSVGLSVFELKRNIFKLHPLWNFFSNFLIWEFSREFTLMVKKC